uniref:protein ANTAGONIST OF LIKE HETEROCHROMATIN PROTEIN 1-like n=1 Tax=Styela clava TaxID=7725 RepID=UPI001939BCA0|nr:protein ANTAGONIST OF LIKE HETEROCHROMATIN PROTEIN 1-like [Styela clava]XP_039256635.1 protein ANTAGONIST OF LIKE HETEROCHROMATIN PROTEIN 1-like [Styela clava]XP_039256636.1 protein ANTAGONIST OF LIKE HETEROCHROMATIN PROTEIN 1-like [Styela clava]XP_039256637.1 protein ANTAGONIST OF LIKE HETEROCHROMATIN PROTEIN 1-like [Styela clava]
MCCNSFVSTSGQTTKTTSQLLDVDEAIVISSLNRFVKAMLNKKSELIMMPNFDEARQISDRFKDKFKCPQVIGTLGSIHIPEGVLNERRSASHTAMSRLVLQALVDDEYKFRDIFITTTVKSNYAEILEESKLYKDGLPEYSLNIEGTEVPFYVAANNEYPLLSWVITPFHDSKIEGYKERESFNEQLSSILQQVEIAFARLKTRWKILQSNSFMSNHNAKDIIACVVCSIIFVKPLILLLRKYYQQKLILVSANARIVHK